MATESLMFSQYCFDVGFDVVPIGYARNVSCRNAPLSIDQECIRHSVIRQGFTRLRRSIFSK
jgi:hypothetical protein